MFRGEIKYHFFINSPKDIINNIITQKNYMMIGLKFLIFVNIEKIVYLVGKSQLPWSDLDGLTFSPSQSI